MPSIQWIWAIAVVFVFFNSFVYVAILHSVYTIVSRIVIPDKPDYVRAPERMKKILLAQARSIHWFPYDPVRVVNAVP